MVDEGLRAFLSLNLDREAAEQRADNPSRLKVEVAHQAPPDEVEGAEQNPSTFVWPKQSAPHHVMVAGLLAAAMIRPKPRIDEPIPATVALAKPLPPAPPTRTRLSPEHEAAQRAMDNPALWLAEWQAMLKREKLPVSWPAAAGVPPDTGVCGCCGTRSWWLNEDGTQGSSHWICAACHPPPVSRVVQSKWSPTVAPSPVVAEGAAVSSGGGYA